MISEDLWSEWGDSNSQHPAPKGVLCQDERRVRGAAGENDCRGAGEDQGGEAEDEGGINCPKYYGKKAIIKGAGFPAP